MRAAPSTRSVTRLARLAFAMVASVFLHAVASAPVFANAGLGVQVIVPPTVSVGQVNLPANIDIQNTSTPDTLTVTLNTISLVPSCGAYSFITCTGLDPNVFSGNTPAIGRAGTACAGVVFTTAPSGLPDGSITFTPASTIVLGTPGSATDKCIIDFTFNVLKMPTIDASVAPGIQTLPSALVSGTASDTSTAVGFGTAFFVTVNPATPAIFDHRHVRPGHDRRSDQRHGHPDRRRQPDRHDHLPPLRARPTRPAPRRRSSPTPRR